MMVQDGTLKPAPNDDELHPATVPSAGPSATLSSTDQPGSAADPLERTAGDDHTPALPSTVGGSS